MIRTMTYFMAGGVTLHALIHLLGFVAYWPLAKLGELPYKTSLINGRWAVGEGGMRLFGFLWLLVAVGMVAGTAGSLFKQPWGLPLLGGAALFSLLICSLDWQVAFRGAILSSLLLMGVLLVYGLQVRPEPFAAVDTPPVTFETRPLPDSLPPPVARYYQVSIGDEIPVIESGVVTGRGTVRVAGITFPARLRFTYAAGEGYRHYIEATWYGWPLLQVNEWYLDGAARLELPFGVVENDPKVDMAANLGLWGESIWLSPIFLTDPRVRWEGVDARTALLHVPFNEEGEDTFTVFFDPQSGLIERLEAWRYKDAADTERTMWILEPRGWERRGDLLIPSPATATWADDGSPWLVMEVEEAVFNLPVSGRLTGRGPE